MYINIGQEFLNSRWWEWESPRSRIAYFWDIVYSTYMHPSVPWFDTLITNYNIHIQIERNGDRMNNYQLTNYWTKKLKKLASVWLFLLCLAWMYIHKLIVLFIFIFWLQGFPKARDRKQCFSSNGSRMLKLICLSLNYKKIKPSFDSKYLRNLVT